MEYPQEVQDAIAVLKIYEQDDNLRQFDIMHIYPTDECCYPDGYYDSRWFYLHLFNTRSKTKNIIKRRMDGLFLEGHIPLHRVSVYADGSIMMKFREMMSVFILSQATHIEPVRRSFHRNIIRENNN